MTTNKSAFQNPSAADRAEEIETVADWGKTLVVAPHPDDESLGCGGAIALLRKLNQTVEVLTITDGTLSHPNSKKYPPAELRDLRESEMLAALEILDVAPEKVRFLRFKDRNVPDENSEGFAAAVETVKSIFSEIQPATILVPWRRDPHPDHRAAFQICRAANESGGGKIRVLEYPIWLWEMAEIEDLPEENEIKIWRLNVAETAAAQKQKAIHAHRSQITDLIDDDPQGFRLSKEVLAHFERAFEIYLEETR